jgi:hypothetical protein
MKNHQNAILKGALSRVRQLREQYRESSVIEHNPTKGTLREGYLKQFLAEFIPSPFEVTSGFITDCYGDRISPQIDLLVFDRTSIPGLALSRFVAILPLESVRLAIEAKSILTTADFEQIRLQQQAIRQLRFAFTTEDRGYLMTEEASGVPTFIFAFDSQCSESTLQQWFVNEPSLHAVCVVGKCFMLRDPFSGEIENVESNEQNAEVLHFVAFIHMTILRNDRLIRLKSLTLSAETLLPLYSDIGAYFTFDVPKIESDPNNA